MTSMTTRAARPLPPPDVDAPTREARRLSSLLEVSQALSGTLNLKASLHRVLEILARHHGAKLVVRVVCELYPNCPRGVPDLTTGAPSPYAPRPGYDPPPPEWKSRDYIRDILPRDDPHAATVRRRDD